MDDIRVYVTGDDFSAGISIARFGENLTGKELVVATGIPREKVEFLAENIRRAIDHARNHQTLTDVTRSWMNRD